MAIRKIEFKINPKIFDDLKEIEKKLPERATGSNRKGGAEAYDHPAGMALLGTKDGEMDTVIPLTMSGGCWDAPNISFKDMDAGFRALIATDRICGGMALIRHPTWHTASVSDQGMMPTHLKGQLHNMKRSFDDITKTAWIVLHNNYFRVYRPTVNADGRVGCKEINIDSLFKATDKEVGIIKKKLERTALIKKQKKEAAERKKKEIEEYKKRREKEIAEYEAKIAKIDEDLKIVNDKLKVGKDDMVEIGDGYVFMKGKDGKYILWKAGRKK